MNSRENISRGSIRRLARRAGVKRISVEVYETLRNHLSEFLGQVIHKTLLYTKHNRRKTISALDVVNALQRIIGHYYGIDTGKTKKKTSSQKKTDQKPKKKKSKLFEAPSPGPQKASLASTVLFEQPSPDRQVTLNDLTPASAKKKPTPKEKTPTPKRKTPTPSKEKTPTPPKKKTPTPPKEKTPTPKRKTPTPPKEKTPSPKQKTPSPKRKTPTPPKQKTPSPKRKTPSSKRESPNQTLPVSDEVVQEWLQDMAQHYSPPKVTPEQDTFIQLVKKPVSHRECRNVLDWFDNSCYMDSVLMVFLLPLWDTLSDLLESVKGQPPDRRAVCTPQVRDTIIKEMESLANRLTSGSQKLIKCTNFRSLLSGCKSDRDNNWAGNSFEDPYEFAEYLLQGVLQIPMEKYMIRENTTWLWRQEYFNHFFYIGVFPRLHVSDRNRNRSLDKTMLDVPLFFEKYDRRYVLTAVVVFHAVDHFGTVMRCGRDWYEYDDYTKKEKWKKLPRFPKEFVGTNGYLYIYMEELRFYTNQYIFDKDTRIFEKPKPMTLGLEEKPVQVIDSMLLMNKMFPEIQFFLKEEADYIFMRYKDHNGKKLFIKSYSADHSTEGDYERECYQIWAQVAVRRQWSPHFLLLEKHMVVKNLVWLMLQKYPNEKSEILKILQSLSWTVSSPYHLMITEEIPLNVNQWMVTNHTQYIKDISESTEIKKRRLIYVLINFQIFYTLELLRRMRIRHNDFHLGNIRVRAAQGKFIDAYEIDGFVFYLPRLVEVFFFDWGYTYVLGLENKILDGYLCKDLQVCNSPSDYYDLYKFICDVERIEKKKATMPLETYFPKVKEVMKQSGDYAKFCAMPGGFENVRFKTAGQILLSKDIFKFADNKFTDFYEFMDFQKSKRILAGYTWNDQESKSYMMPTPPQIINAFLTVPHDKAKVYVNKLMEMYRM